MGDEQDSDSNDTPFRGFEEEPSPGSNERVTRRSSRPSVSSFYIWNSGSSAIGQHGDKRKKVTVTMEEKLRALQRLDAGESPRVIAEQLNVGKSTVSDWKKHRIEIERWYANQAGGSCIKARKTMRKGKHAQVEKALFHWYEYVTSKGFQVSGPLLQQKALQFKVKMEGEEGEKFSASEGWLDRWKKRFGIGPLLNNNCMQDDNENMIEELKRDFFELDNLKEEQLYCCGRILLNYRMLPTNVLGSKACVDAERKVNEESVIVFACSNATGNHKLRLTFVGKSEKLQALETIEGNEFLPFRFCQQNEIWLDGNLLKTWFESEFVPAVEKNLTLNRLPRKAVLLVTSYPSFADLAELHDGDIKVVFVPLQAALLCQPMHRGVLESLKKKYWCRLLSSVISTSTDKKNCLKTLKNIDILEAVQFTSEAWEEITSMTLIQSWKHLTNQTEDNDLADCEDHDITLANDDKELVTLLKQIGGCDDVSLEEINEWIGNEDEDEIVSEDIAAMVLKEPPPELERSEEISANDEKSVTDSVEIKAEFPVVVNGDSCAENIPPVHLPINQIRHSEGFKAIMKALEYVSQQEEATPEDILWLLKWREIAAKKSLQEGRQKKSVKRPKLL